MRRVVPCVWILGCVSVWALGPAPARASILGSWTLEMSGTLEGEETPCVFRGTAEVSPAGPESKADFSGPCHMDLVSGPQACAPVLDGTIEITTQLSEAGLEVSGFIDGGQELGLADFTGVVVGDPTANGTFLVASGPFSGYAGTWSGSLAVSVVAIPTLRASGLVLLVALLALSSAWVLRRRRA